MIKFSQFVTENAEVASHFSRTVDTLSATHQMEHDPERKKRDWEDRAHMIRARDSMHRGNEAEAREHYNKVSESGKRVATGVRYSTSKAFRKWAGSN